MRTLATTARAVELAMHDDRIARARREPLPGLVTSVALEALRSQPRPGSNRRASASAP